MEKYYTEDFDAKLKVIDIYKKYELLMPFVGSRYHIADKKVLFIGESHYLPEKYNNVSDTSWYEKNLEDYQIDDKAKIWLSTRYIINNHVINREVTAKSHDIYRNIGNVFGEVFEMGDYTKSLPYVSFYNYFLRPAEVKGKSINNEDTDNKVSFKVLLRLTEILSPNKIIFVSRKAKKVFDSIYNKEIDLGLIDSIQHPGSIHWNKPAKVNNGLTGKEKLMEILRKLK